jgi:hypothetical protein
MPPPLVHRCTSGRALAPAQQPDDQAPEQAIDVAHDLLKWM